MMNNGEIVLNRSVKIIQDTGKLQITKAFAEKNLSKSALKYAERTDRYYNFNWGKNAFIVVFEIPKLFNFTFPEILRFLVNYCLPYMEENRLTESVIYPKFLENYNKQITP